jgi:chromosome segregation ATPase
MLADKPARQYTKLINDLKMLQQRNRELEAEALCTAGRIQDAIDTALTIAKASHDDTVDKILHQTDALRKELDTAMTALSTTTAERDEAQGSLLAVTVRADGLAAQAADIQPQLDLITQQRADLTHILDTVRDRMRRKEQQDEQAILNRRALARVTPGKNWG